MEHPKLGYNDAVNAERSFSPNHQTWVEQTLQKMEADARAQPWKKTFSDRVVNSGFDDGKDIITIKETIDGSEASDAITPEGNSLAA